MRRRKRDHNEIDYWQSNTDLMSALVLVLMLIIMLLILYLMQIPEYDQPESEKGDGYKVDNELGDDDGVSYHHPDGTSENNGGGGGQGEGDETEEDEGEEESEGGGNGGGGGGSGTGIGNDPEYQYEYPLPTHNGEDWNKAAVFATVVDEETGRAIREEGITFELYEEQLKGDGGALRFLNTYYPVKTEYRNYETTEEGVFYLPEKIEEGHYYFKQITELEGYDLAEAVHFDLDDTYDWPDPYVVSIEISPSKNIIPITIEDEKTHELLSDGTFAVLAAEDIVTADKTTRYVKGETADTVTFDEEGHGQSKELYLGKYTVVQKQIPQYYAGVKSGVNVKVKKKDGSTPATVKFSCGKTKISLKLTDNLYTNLKLEGAEFELQCKSHPELTQTAKTDKNGEIVFTDLEKNSVYTLKQINAPENYRFDDSGLEFFVDESGWIEEEAEASCDLTNYIPRVSIGIRDKFFGKPVSDVNLALYDSGDKKISTWTSNGSDKVFENLPEGSYYVLVDGSKEKRYEFKASNDIEMQEVTASILTMQNILAVAAGGLAFVVVILGMIMILKKSKSSKHNKTGKEMSSGE